MTNGNRNKIFKSKAKLTEQEQAQQSIQTGRKYADDIVNAVREPLVVLDTKLHVISANESFYKTFQVKPKETIGKLIYKIGNGQWNIPKLKALLERILPKNKVFNDYEVKHDFPKIGTKIMLLNARQIDSLQLILLAIEDITIRKQLEQRLANYTSDLEKQVTERTKSLALARARDEAILQSIGDGLIVFVDADKGGKIIYVNKAFEEMMGWKTKEVMNKYIVDIVPREDKDGNKVPFKERVMTKVLAGQKIVTDVAQPYYYVRRDKTKFPAASIVTPIVLNKKIIGAVETFRDITKESAADKVKTEFASLVSHQLRTPFTTINWYLELLLSEDVGQLNDRQIQYMQEAYNASKRMVILINVLLSISRIETGTTTIEEKQINVVSLVETVLKEFEREIQTKRFKIEKVYDSNPPTIHADPKQLNMVFQNLISNAIKYTPDEGKITLKVGFDKQDIIVTVADTGMGIPKNSQHNIFGRFFRAENAKFLDPEGTGLGLYILKAIVDQMKGSIWFESKENKGTTFYMSLPIKRSTKIRKDRQPLSI